MLVTSPSMQYAIRCWANAVEVVSAGVSTPASDSPERRRHDPGLFACRRLFLPHRELHPSKTFSSERTPSSSHLQYFPFLPNHWYLRQILPCPCRLDVVFGAVGDVDLGTRATISRIDKAIPKNLMIDLFCSNLVMSSSL